MQLRKKKFWQEAKEPENRAGWWWGGGGVREGCASVCSALFYAWVSIIIVYWMFTLLVVYTLYKYIYLPSPSSHCPLHLWTVLRRSQEFTLQVQDSLLLFLLIIMISLQLQANCLCGFCKTQLSHALKELPKSCSEGTSQMNFVSDLFYESLFPIVHRIVQCMALAHCAQSKKSGLCYVPVQKWLLMMCMQWSCQIYFKNGVTCTR